VSRTPFLALRGLAVDLAPTGQTIATRAIETADEHEWPPRILAHGTRQPWLAARARIVEGETGGKSIITRAAPETSDEGDEAE
jgi:hypothetical protein